MSTATTAPNRQSREVATATGTPGTAQAFRHLATKMAGDLLTNWVGEDRAGEAIGRIATALSASAAAAKKPEDFYSCTPASIATCVAIAALTGIMPGHGSTALAYLIPRSPRRGEQKQLGFAFSHRGLNALARRSGQMMKAIPIGLNDRVKISVDGDVDVQDLDLDNPPMEYEDLRGVVVVVKNLDGTVMARGWMPKILIDKRRDSSDSYTYACKPGNEWAKDSDPWHVWPVEMAMKSAMHYAIARGWCVIDDTSSVRALASDISVQAITVDSHPSPRLPPSNLGELTDRLTTEAGHDAAPLEELPKQEEPQKAEGGDQWEQFTKEVSAATKVGDLREIKNKYQTSFPDKHDDFLFELAEAENKITESRKSGGKKAKDELFDRAPTAQTEGA